MKKQICREVGRVLKHFLFFYSWPFGDCLYLRRHCVLTDEEDAVRQGIFLKPVRRQDPLPLPERIFQTIPNPSALNLAEKRKVY